MRLSFSGPYIATSFADSRDVRDFLRCKNENRSDAQCFKVGDNGRGKWGADCTDLSKCYVALPPEVWQVARLTGGAPVVLRFRGATRQAFLGDTMPHVRYITNGARLDLSPGTLYAFGLRAPYKGGGWEYALGTL